MPDPYKVAVKAIYLDLIKEIEKGTDLPACRAWAVQFLRYKIDDLEGGSEN